MTKLQKLLQQLGPGLLYAGAAVGVSHLVQSTKAGALFGFQLIPLIILIHLIKYPFYEYGPRYTAATGQNILHGYRKLGAWAVVIYALMTLATMVIIQSAITIVTASLAFKIFGLSTLKVLGYSITPVHISIVLLLGCTALLLIGRYSLLDKIMKVVILLLTVSTIFAVGFSLFKNPGHYQSHSNPVELSNAAHIGFLVVFLGWMPAPMDISVWHSIWSHDKQQESGEKSSMKNAMLDFRVGYIGTAILAIFFLLLGTLIMYGSGENFSSKGTVFAGQLISMYKTALGSWAVPLVAGAALMTMFSTTLTCLDAYPRSLRVSQSLLFGSKGDCRKSYSFYLLLSTVGTVIVLLNYLKNMGTMIAIATTIAFVAAPILSLLNYLAMNHQDVPAEFRPKKTAKIYALCGLIILSALSAGYVQDKFFNDPKTQQAQSTKKAQP